MIGRALFPLSAEKPWRVHVYGPALRWNEYNPKKRVPEIAVHPYGFDYRVMFLCDRVFPQPSKQLPNLGSHPDDPLPAGVGGKVVVYMTVYGPLQVKTDDPWNWPEKLKGMDDPRRHPAHPDHGDIDWTSPVGPPRIFIGAEVSKAALYSKVLHTYLRAKDLPPEDRL